MNSRIETIKEILVYSETKNKWVKLYFDKVKFPNGKEGFYNRIIENNGNQGVVVLPIVKKYIGIVHQFRYPIFTETWELPRGFGESNSTNNEAVRELFEETGIKILPEKLLYLGKLYPNSGILASIVDVYAAVFDDFPPIERVSDKEIAEFKWIEYKDLLVKISEGDINDSFTIASLLKAQIRGLI